MGVMWMRGQKCRRIWAPFSKEFSPTPLPTPNSVFPIVLHSQTFGFVLLGCNLQFLFAFCTEGLLFLLLYMVALLPHMTIVSLMFFLCMYLNFTQLIYLTLLLFVDASHLDANVSSFLNYFSCPHVCCSHQKEKNVAIFATVTSL